MDEASKVEEKIGLLQKTFECPICLELMKNPFTTKCDHKFCRHCILEVIGHQSSAPCPICKLPFTKRSLQRLEHWNKIVKKVDELIVAFQTDTGAIFSPHRGASIPLSQSVRSTPAPTDPYTPGVPQLDLDQEDSEALERLLRTDAEQENTDRNTRSKKSAQASTSQAAPGKCNVSTSSCGGGVIDRGIETKTLGNSRNTESETANKSVLRTVEDDEEIEDISGDMFRSHNTLRRCKQRKIKPGDSRIHSLQQRETETNRNSRENETEPRTRREITNRRASVNLIRPNVSTETLTTNKQNSVSHNAIAAYLSDGNLLTSASSDEEANGMNTQGLNIKDKCKKANDKRFEVSYEDNVAGTLPTTEDPILTKTTNGCSSLGNGNERSDTSEQLEVIPATVQKQLIRRTSKRNVSAVKQCTDSTQGDMFVSNNSVAKNNKQTRRGGDRYTEQNPPSGNVLNRTISKHRIGVSNEQCLETVNDRQDSNAQMKHKKTAGTLTKKIPQKENSTASDTQLFDSQKTPDIFKGQCLIKSYGKSHFNAKQAISRSFRDDTNVTPKYQTRSRSLERPCDSVESSSSMHLFKEPKPKPVQQNARKTRSKSRQDSVNTEPKSGAGPKTVRRTRSMIVSESTEAKSKPGTHARTPKMARLHKTRSSSDVYQFDFDGSSHEKQKEKGQGDGLNTTLERKRKESRERSSSKNQRYEDNDYENTRSVKGVHQLSEHQTRKTGVKHHKSLTEEKDREKQHMKVESKALEKQSVHTRSNSTREAHEKAVENEPEKITSKDASNDTQKQRTRNSKEYIADGKDLRQMKKGLVAENHEKQRNEHTKHSKGETMYPKEEPRKSKRESKNKPATDKVNVVDKYKKYRKIVDWNSQDEKESEGEAGDMFQATNTGDQLEITDAPLNCDDKPAAPFDNIQTIDAPSEASQQDTQEKVHEWLDEIPSSISPLLSAEAYNNKYRITKQVASLRELNDVSQECLVATETQYQEKCTFSSQDTTEKETESERNIGLDEAIPQNNRTMNSHVQKISKRPAFKEKAMGTAVIGIKDVDVTFKVIKNQPVSKTAVSVKTISEKNTSSDDGRCDPDVSFIPETPVVNTVPRSINVKEQRGEVLHKEKATIRDSNVSPDVEDRNKYCGERIASSSVGDREIQDISIIPETLPATAGEKKTYEMLKQQDKDAKNTAAEQKCTSNENVVQQQQKTNEKGSRSFAKTYGRTVASTAKAIKGKIKNPFSRMSRRSASTAGQTITARMQRFTQQQKENCSKSAHNENRHKGLVEQAPPKQRVLMHDLDFDRAVQAYHSNIPMDPDTSSVVLQGKNKDLDVLADLSNKRDKSKGSMQLLKNRIFKTRSMGVDEDGNESQSTDSSLMSQAPVDFVHGSPVQGQDPYAFRMSQRTPKHHRTVGKKGGANKRRKKKLNLITEGQSVATGDDASNRVPVQKTDAASKRVSVQSENNAVTEKGEPGNAKQRGREQTQTEPNKGDQSPIMRHNETTEVVMETPLMDIRESEQLRDNLPDVTAPDKQKRGKKKKTSKESTSHADEETSQKQDTQQLDALIDKISEAEDFELMLSQQFRDMQEEARMDEKEETEIIENQDRNYEKMGKQTGNKEVKSAKCRRVHARQRETHKGHHWPERKPAGHTEAAWGMENASNVYSDQKQEFQNIIKKVKHDDDALSSHEQVASGGQIQNPKTTQVGFQIEKAKIVKEDGSSICIQIIQRGSQIEIIGDTQSDVVISGGRIPLSDTQGTSLHTQGTAFDNQGTVNTVNESQSVFLQGTIDEFPQVNGQSCEVKHEGYSTDENDVIPPTVTSMTSDVGGSRRQPERSELKDTSSTCSDEIQGCSTDENDVIPPSCKDSKEVSNMRVNKSDIPKNQITWDDAEMKSACVAVPERPAHVVPNQQCDLASVTTVSTHATANRHFISRPNNDAVKMDRDCNDVPPDADDVSDARDNDYVTPSTDDVSDTRDNDDMNPLNNDVSNVRDNDDVTPSTNDVSDARDNDDVTPSTNDVSDARDNDDVTPSTNDVSDARDNDDVTPSTNDVSDARDNDDVTPSTYDVSDARDNDDVLPGADEVSDARDNDVTPSTDDLSVATLQEDRTDDVILATNDDAMPLQTDDVTSFTDEFYRNGTICNNEEITKPANQVKPITQVNAVAVSEDDIFECTNQIDSKNESADAMACQQSITGTNTPEGRSAEPVNISDDTEIHILSQRNGEDSNIITKSENAFDRNRDVENNEVSTDRTINEEKESTLSNDEHAGNQVTEILEEEQRKARKEFTGEHQTGVSQSTPEPVQMNNTAEHTRAPADNTDSRMHHHHGDRETVDMDSKTGRSVRKNWRSARRMEKDLSHAGRRVKRLQLVQEKAANQRKKGKGKKKKPTIESCLGTKKQQKDEEFQEALRAATGLAKINATNAAISDEEVNIVSATSVKQCKSAISSPKKQSSPQNETESEGIPNAVIDKVKPHACEEPEDREEHDVNDEAKKVDMDEVLKPTSQRKCFRLSTNDSPVRKSKPIVSESMELNELIAEAAQLIDPDQFSTIPEESEFQDITKEKNNGEINKESETGGKLCEDSIYNVLSKSNGHMNEESGQKKENSKCADSEETQGDVVSAATGASDVSDDVIPLPINQSKCTSKRICSTHNNTKERTSETSEEIENKTRSGRRTRKDCKTTQSSSVISGTNTEESILLLQPSVVLTPLQLARRSDQISFPENERNISTEKDLEDENESRASRSDTEGIESMKVVRGSEKDSICVIESAAQGDSPNDIFAASVTKTDVESQSEIGNGEILQENDIVPSYVQTEIIPAEGCHADLVDGAAISTEQQDASDPSQLQIVPNQKQEEIDDVGDDVMIPSQNSDVSMDSDASGLVIVEKRRSLKRKSSDGHTNVKDDTIPFDSKRELKKRKKSEVNKENCNDDLSTDSEASGRVKVKLTNRKRKSGDKITEKESSVFKSGVDDELNLKSQNQELDQSHKQDTEENKSNEKKNIVDLSNETERGNTKTASISNEVQVTKKRRLRRSVIPPLVHSNRVQPVSEKQTSMDSTSRSLPTPKKTLEIRLTPIQVKDNDLRPAHVIDENSDKDPIVLDFENKDIDSISTNRRRSKTKAFVLESEHSDNDDTPVKSSGSLSRLRKQGIVSDDNSDALAENEDSPIKPPSSRRTSSRLRTRKRDEKKRKISSRLRRKARTIPGSDSESGDGLPSLESCELGNVGVVRKERLTGKGRPIEIGDENELDSNLQPQLASSPVTLMSSASQNPAHSPSQDEAVASSRQKRRAVMLSESDESDVESVRSRTMNVTSSSAISSQSELLNSQKKDELENDVLGLRDEIAALEAEIDQGGAAMQIDDAETFDPCASSADSGADQSEHRTQSRDQTSKPSHANVNSETDSNSAKRKQDLNIIDNILNMDESNDDLPIKYEMPKISASDFANSEVVNENDESFESDEDLFGPSQPTNESKATLFGNTKFAATSKELNRDRLSQELENERNLMDNEKEEESRLGEFVITETPDHDDTKDEIDESKLAFIPNSHVEDSQPNRTVQGGKLSARKVSLQTNDGVAGATVLPSSLNQSQDGKYKGAPPVVGFPSTPDNQLLSGVTPLSPLSPSPPPDVKNSKRIISSPKRVPMFRLDDEQKSVISATMDASLDVIPATEDQDTIDQESNNSSVGDSGNAAIKTSFRQIVIPTVSQKMPEIMSDTKYQCDTSLDTGDQLPETTASVDQPTALRSGFETVRDSDHIPNRNISKYSKVSDEPPRSGPPINIATHASKTSPDVFNSDTGVEKNIKTMKKIENLQSPHTAVSSLHAPSETTDNKTSPYVTDSKSDKPSATNKSSPFVTDSHSDKTSGTSKSSSSKISPNLMLGCVERGLDGGELLTPRRPALQMIQGGNAVTPSRDTGSAHKSALQGEKGIKQETTQLWSPTVSRSMFPQKPFWTFCCTGISKVMHKPYIDKLVQLLGCKFINKYNPAVTHVLVKPADSNPRLCARTLKYFQGIAGKAWIVSVQWCIDSVKQKRMLPQEDYEIKGDTLGGQNVHHAPMRARQSEERLLEDFELCCLGTFELLQTSELRGVAETCGASLVENPTLFTFNPRKKSVVVVEQSRADEMLELPRIHKVYGLPIVSKEWLLDSVGEYEVKTLDKYLLFTTT